MDGKGYMSAVHDSKLQVPGFEGFPWLKSEDVFVDPGIQLEEASTPPVKIELKTEDVRFNLKPEDDDIRAGRIILDVTLAHEDRDVKPVSIKTLKIESVRDFYSVIPKVEDGGSQLNINVLIPSSADESPSQIGATEQPSEVEPEAEPVRSGVQEMNPLTVKNESMFDTMDVDATTAATAPSVTEGSRMDERQDFRIASLGAGPSVKTEPEEVGILDLPGMSKRRRYIMDGVFLPTAESLGIKRRRADDQCLTEPQLKKIKKLDRSAGLAAGTLRKRLISAGIKTDPFTITLPAHLMHVSARRDFMSIYYGGDCQSTFPPITAESYTRTGYRYFMYPNLVQNPDAPMIPGAPGLFLYAAGWSANECNKEWATKAYNLKVLTRLGTHDFLYMGEYAIRPSDSLTQAEWMAQTQAMQKRWCTKLAKKDWGLMTRTRIALRRQLGRDATFKEVAKSLKAKQKFLSITADDIAKAFNNGDERLAVWTMKCVGYDEQFQRDVVQKITDWVPPPPKIKAVTTSKSKKASTTKMVCSRTRGVQRPRRRALTVESEDESEEL